jgi:hypothetical protein
VRHLITGIIGAFNILSNRGGGNKSNVKLSNAATPALWMGNEAIVAGLRLKPSEVVWNWRALKNDPVSSSINWKCWPLEILPIKRLTYKDETSTWWWSVKFKLCQFSISFDFNYRRPHFAQP